MSALSRRSLVTTAAALPALAVPAIAVAASAEPDPISAMLEEHSTAVQAWNNAVGIEFGLRWKDPQREAAEMETGLCDIKHNRFTDITAASPTTVEGVAALLEYVYAIASVDDGLQFEQDDLLVTMVNAATMLREIVAR
jgi:hypothetical protein